MKKSHNHIIKLKRDRGGRGGPRPAILNYLSPIPAQPFAVVVQKALRGNELDATKVYFAPLLPEEE